MIELYLSSFNKLKAFCQKEHYKGWDPYDGLNSTIFSLLPLLPRHKFTRIAWIQFMKRMPFNLRPLLGIQKGFNPKGISLFLSGYCQMHNIGDDKSEALHEINLLADKLISLQTKGYAGSCWGYNFDWEARAFFQPKHMPNVVVTSYVANSLMDAYEITGKDAYLSTALSAKKFILNDLNQTSDGNGNFCFSYSPNDKSSVFNASLLGARLLSRIYCYTREEKLIETAKRTVSFCCKYQNADGSWYYSPLPFHQWIDSFHTGFNLECIYDYANFSGDTGFLTNFNNGIKYYLRTFFDVKGRSKYYHNALYPIDIHAPSQFIITLSKSNLAKDHLNQIENVLAWTIKNMQSHEGYFYFRKKRFYTNKIPYMRWSQGWMFYALAHYLSNISPLTLNSTRKFPG